VGVFPELEDQLTSYEAGSSDSPDRLDAMVWAVTELMVTGLRPMTWVPPFTGGERPSWDMSQINLGVDAGINPAVASGFHEGNYNV
jgi:hypothetical protein